MPEESFSSWAIVEVMGHSRYAGHVTEQAIAGASFVRVDVPATDKQAAFTKLLGASSIFCITPCDEEVARVAAAHSCTRPLVGVVLPEEMRRAIDAGRRLLASEDSVPAPNDETEDVDHEGDDE